MPIWKTNDDLIHSNELANKAKICDMRHGLLLIIYLWLNSKSSISSFYKFNKEEFAQKNTKEIFKHVASRLTQIHTETIKKKLLQK